VMCWQKIAG
ncbi:hypothetical protein BVZ80_01279B, partial [Haemophilus influenzae]